MNSANAFIGKNKIAALSSEVNISKEDFISKTNAIEEVPLGNQSLAFKVRLPKNWIKQNQDATANLEANEILVQVATYLSPPRIERKSIFRVSVISLDSLITAEDWFISYMLEMGFSIEGMKVESPKLVQAQYTVFEDGEPYGVRAVISLSESKIVLAEYLVHQDMYAVERGEQVWAMSGFSLVNPSKKVEISTKNFNFVDIAKFDYPATWSLRAPDIIDITRMEASVVNTKSLSDAKGELRGRIDVSIIAKSQEFTLQDEINILSESLKTRGYKLGKFIETIPENDFNPLITTSRIDAYYVEGVSTKLIGYEFWVAALQSKGRYYLIRLTTMSRAENFRVWAENVETYKFLLRSLGPVSVSSEEEEQNQSE